MISSLYNRENSVKPGHCVATANKPNTICPSASALGEDEFGRVPYRVIGGRSANEGRGKSVDVRWPSFNKKGLVYGFIQNTCLIFSTYITYIVIDHHLLHTDCTVGRGGVKCIII